MAKSEWLEGRCDKIERAVREASGRSYKVVIVESESDVVVVLPSLIVLSKNILVAKLQEKDIANVVLLMEALFTRRNHIHDLAPQNIALFLQHRLRPTNLTDLKITTIYTPTYTHDYARETITLMAAAYRIPEA